MSVTPYQQEAFGVFATRLYEPDKCASIVARVKDHGDWEAAQVVVDSGGQSSDATLPETRAARTLNRSHDMPQPVTTSRKGFAGW